MELSGKAPLILRPLGAARSLSARRHTHPRLALGGIFDHWQQLLHFHRVIEIGMKRCILGHALDEIGQCCDEGMLVPDYVSRRPEMADVRMIGTGYEHGVTTPYFCGIFTTQDLQPIPFLDVATCAASRT